MERQTLKEHRSPRGADNRNRGSNNLSRVERDVKAYELTLQGCSVRAVCEELGIKSTQTAHNSIQRGKAIVIEKGIDVDERRIDIDRMFKNTLGMLVQTAQNQSINGCIETIHSPEGITIKTRQGIDPRIAGELSRSLNRWAEFCGLLDRAPEVTSASTTLINLSAPADGASFGSKWGGETVDVASSDHVSDHNQGSTPLKASESLEGPTVDKAVVVQK